MAKGNKVAATAAVVAVAAPVAAVMYSVGKLPRSGLNQGTKHGQGGTAGTYQAVVAALQKAGAGGLPITAIQAVCKANGDAGFARYAVRNHWLLPVQAS